MLIAFTITVPVREGEKYYVCVCILQILLANSTARIFKVWRLQIYVLHPKIRFPLKSKDSLDLSLKLKIGWISR